MPEHLKGYCLCGATRWVYDGPVTRKLVCHCRDCQLATSSGFTAFVGVINDKIQWVVPPNHYQSSEGCWRGFCPNCGTRLYFRSSKWPDEIHMHSGTLDNPADYMPDKHVVCASGPDWIVLSDDLPRNSGFDRPPEPHED